jgi:hypothetical protein
MTSVVEPRNAAAAMKAVGAFMKGSLNRVSAQGGQVGRLWESRRQAAIQ